MSLYYLVVPGTIYIRNFYDRGDTPLHPYTRFPTSVQRMEVTLIPDQSTNLQHLIQFTRSAFSENARSLVYSKSTPFHFVAQIDWSLLQNQYYNINKLVDSLSCHHGLNYHLAFTNIIPGGESFRSAELYITSTGGTGGTRLKLPLHGFLDDGLVTYLSSSAGLPSPLTEICMEDTIPLDATTLSWASRNLVRLLENRANDIQRATFSITLPQIHTLIPKLPRLYDLTFTQPESNTTSPFATSSIEHIILASLSSSSYNTSSRLSTPSSRSISILTLPAHLFASPLIRNKISRLRRLQELKIMFTSPLDVTEFGHLPIHRGGDFTHLRCLTFEGGTIPQFISLLPTLFPSPFYSPSPRSSISTSTSSPHLPTSPTPSSITSTQRPRKFINLTLLVSALSSSSSLIRLVSSINTYIPHGIDIFKLHIKDWGVGEPKNGAWWAKAEVCVNGGGRRRTPGLMQVPGRVMADLAHPCREEIGCRVKVKKSKVKRIWRRMVRSMRKETGTVNVGESSESASMGSLGSKMLDLKRWWERWRYSKVVLPVEQSR